MKLQAIPAGELNPVAGVFGTSPVIRGETVQIGHNHRGVPGLVQEGRIIAISDQQPQLLCFAALNGLPVKDYTEKRPRLAPREVLVFCLD